MTGQDRRGSGKTSPFQKLREQAETKVTKVDNSMQKMSTSEISTLMQELRIHQVELEMQNEELRKSQAETEQSRKSYQDLWELSPAEYFLLDVAGRVDAFNRAGQKLFGKREDMLLKERFSTLVAPEDQVSVRLLLERVMETAVVEKREIRIILPDDAIHTYLLEAHLLKSRSGQEQVQVVLTDITRQKQAKEALQVANDELELRVERRIADLVEINEKLRQEIEERKRVEKSLHEAKNLLSSTFNVLQDSVIVIDKNFHVRMSNWKGFEYILEKDRQGYPLCHEVFMHSKKPCNPCHVTEVFATGKTMQIEHKNPIDGKIRDVHMFPMFDEKGKVDAVIEHCRDITDHKTSEDRIHKLSQQLIEAHENERQMISRELHDRVAQDLSTLKIICETFFDDQVIQSLETRNKITEFSNLLDRTILTVRDLTYDLRPPGIGDMGLVAGLVMYCDEFAEKSQLEVDFQAHGIDRLTLGVDAEINIYRLVQEGLNNIRKHADASKATIRLVGSFPNLILRIEDNGKGFDVEERARTAENEKRMGLRSMAERVNLLKGQMNIRSHLNRGTKIEIKLPHQEIKDG